MKDPASKLIPFDLERAKAGDPVITRDGREARILCFDRINTNKDYPIVFLVPSRDQEDEEIHTCGLNGRGSVHTEYDSYNDLFMKPLNIIRYRLVWVDSISKIPQYKDYDSMEDALLIYNDLPEAIFPFPVPL